MRAMALLIMGMMVALCSGCSPFSVAKAGLKVVKGVDADVLPVRDVTTGKLSAYNTLKLGKVGSDLGPICPAEAISEVRAKARENFADETKDSFKGGPKVLVANIAVRFFKKKGRIGGEGRLDLYVTLVDGESGEEVGRLYVEGISESPMHTGIDDMAKKTTEKLAKYLNKKKKD